MLDNCDSHLGFGGETPAVSLITLELTGRSAPFA